MVDCVQTLTNIGQKERVQERVNEDGGIVLSSYKFTQIIVFEHPQHIDGS